MARGGDGMNWRLARAGITEREADVLSAVAERLHNREIADRLHISVRTVESHVSALLRKLDVSDRTALAELGVAVCSTTGVDSVLPVPLTSLIGRERETSELTAAISNQRLITLTGPAGVGKTRLALRVGTDVDRTLPDGVRLADLASVGPDLVGNTLARALGVVPQPGVQLREILREVAGELHCLLLVDNCEHVVDEAAELVVDLLSASVHLRVLATSREPLGVPGEVTYEVPTLSVPTFGDSSRPAVAGTFDAVRLFVDRAATASRTFALTEGNVEAVASLCQQLDGLPLAIELAASRIRSFGPHELVEHLGERFALLSSGARTALPRHRTLWNAIDWSYQLLDDGDRALFDRLGVFPADFGFEAAQAVFGTDGRDGSVIELLPQLVDKSLVSTIDSESGRRYRLLETVRAYAVERLAASDDDTSARTRHATYYLTLADEAANGLRGPDQRTWLKRLAAEQPNLRTAHDHIIVSGDTETAWQWVAKLQGFWETTGQRREGFEWIRRSCEIGEPPATITTVTGLSWGSLLVVPSNARVSFDLAQQAVQLASGLGDSAQAQAALALGASSMWIRSELALPALNEALAKFDDSHPWERAYTMEMLALASTELTDALKWAQAGLDLFRRLGDRINAANVLYIMAQESLKAGDTDNVHEWLTECQALAEASGSEDHLAHATVGLSQLAWQRGAHDRAAQLMEECLPTLRRLGDRRCTGRALHVLGERAREEGQLSRAEELLLRSAETIVLAGQSVVLVLALESLAGVRHAQDHWRDAAVLLGTAHTERQSAHPRNRPTEPPDEKLRRSLVQTLGRTGFDAAFGEGTRLPPAQLLQEARRHW
jgi:predicted ATPase/DNA-binding CsgD family transcriptional regulator